MVQKKDKIDKTSIYRPDRPKIHDRSLVWDPRSTLQDKQSRFRVQKLGQSATPLFSKSANSFNS